MRASCLKLGCLEKGLILAVVLGFARIPAVQGEDISSSWWYVPESGTSKATLGALTNDIDNFMSVNMFRNVQINDFMGYLGIDANGLNLGYARNLGSLYIGICYGGSLIDDLYRRVTNQSTDSVLKRDTEITTESEDGDVIQTIHGIVDADGNPVPGTAISRNDISVLLGFGKYGLKLGLAQYLEGTYNPYYDRQYDDLVYDPFGTGAILAEKPIGMSSRMQITEEFISGFRPYLEFGGTSNVGSFLLKPSLRVGLDIHQYSRNNPETSFIFESAGAATPGETELTYIIIDNRDILGDFTEPSAGISLGFDFTQDPRIQTELSLDYDMAFRLYSNNKKAVVFETVDTTLLKQTDGTTDTRQENTEITRFYLTNQIVPAFRFRSDMSERLTVGLTFGIDIDFNIYKDSAVTTVVTDSATPGAEGEPVENNIQLFSVLPKLGLGLSFKLIPERFFVNLGIGINVLKYEDETVVATDQEDPTKQKTTVSKTLSLPSTNLGAGLTFYFNKNIAADMLIITSGLGANVSDLLKFNFLVTMKY
jgi:hypothetical protein